MPLPPKDSQMSVRLPEALKKEMSAYAALTNRSTSHIAMEALREYLSWRTPQIDDLRKAVAAADAGEFATDEDVQTVLQRYAKPPKQKISGARKAPSRQRR